MGKKLSIVKAVEAIDQAGALLVFPIDNQKEPESIWSHFHPRKKMRWEWNENGDDSVADLWHLRAALSTTREVVYTKWYRGRATYFSLKLFPSLLRALNPEGSHQGLSTEARRLLAILEGESPLSTKELKRIADLKGREREKAYEAAMKELWSRLLIVAFGEVEDGAFPSLAVGSTQVLFENLWKKGFAMKTDAAEKLISMLLKPGANGPNPFKKYFESLKSKKLKAAETTKKKAPLKTKGVIHFEDL